MINESEKLRVDLALSIQQIVDLVIYFLLLFNVSFYLLIYCFFKDEKKQTIIFSGWLDMVKYLLFLKMNF